MGDPRLSRRRLLVHATTLSGLAALAPIARRTRDAAPLLRPAGRGDSNRRCAQCGETSHTMLAASCPAAPRLRTCGPNEERA